MAGTGLTVRQLVEGMTLTFDPEKAGDLRAVLQWVVTGDEPGAYHLVIGDGRCTFVHAVHPDPTLRITTPADVWAAIVAGEKDGAEALMGGEWTVSGSDPALALRIKELFRPRDEVVLEVEQSVPGPIGLPAPVWLLLSFVPWVLAWVLVPNLPNGLALGIAGAAAAALAVVRHAAGTLTLNETLAVPAFAALGAIASVDLLVFERTGPALVSLALAVVWGASLVAPGLTGLGEYSRWGFVPGMAHVGQFHHTTRRITALWTLVFLLGGAAGLAAVDATGTGRTLLEVVQYAALPVALVAARLLQRTAATKRLERLEEDLVTFRGVGAGVAVAAGMAMVAGIAG